MYIAKFVSHLNFVMFMPIGTTLFTLETFLLYINIYKCHGYAHGLLSHYNIYSHLARHTCFFFTVNHVSKELKILYKINLSVKLMYLSYYVTVAFIFKFGVRPMSVKSSYTTFHRNLKFYVEMI